MQSILDNIMVLSKKRVNYLHNVNNRGFYEGYQTYLDGLRDEIIEAQEEIKENNSIYLEDELGDIFWDYICLLNSLEEEKMIDKQKVFERCYKKFSERLGKDGEGNGNWDEIKIKQKEELLKEHNFIYNK